MRAAAPGVPILIHANAGAPVVEDGRTVFKDTPEYMASRVRELIEAGANIIGGCCGTNPDHIAAMAKTVRALAAKGELPGRKLGRHWRFSRQAVLDWLATPERKRRAAGFEG